MIVFMLGKILSYVRTVKPASERSWSLLGSIRDLDADVFDTREKASAELARLGPLAEPALAKALQVKLSPEVQIRACRLLEMLHDGPDPRRFALLRTIEALERIGTPEASGLLDQLAKELTVADQAKQANLCLERLKKMQGSDRP
jgi:hypothetical protein